MKIITPCGRYEIEIDADLDEKYPDSPFRIHCVLRDNTVSDNRPFIEKVRDGSLGLENIIASGFVSAEAHSCGQTVDLQDPEINGFWEKK